MEMSQNSKKLESYKYKMCFVYRLDIVKRLKKYIYVFISCPSYQSATKTLIQQTLDLYNLRPNNHFTGICLLFSVENEQVLIWFRNLRRIEFWLWNLPKHRKFIQISHTCSFLRIHLLSVYAFHTEYDEALECKRFTYRGVHKR